jgi:GTP pyrophosphokinase
MRNLKLALYPEEIYVFTPKGEVRAFPKGATPVDFAYSIHTDIGNQCVGARVNRAIVPLKYELKNGDTVDIIIKSGSQPSKDWLKHAVTSKAISKIKQWVKAEEREKSVALGRNILEKEFRKHGLSYKKIIKSGELNEVLKENSLVALDDLMALIGYGKMSVRHILNRFLQEGEEKEKEKEKDDAIIDKLREKFKRSSSAGVSIKGIDDIVVRFAKCCSPLPGDDIVGYITRGRGVSVHVATCPKVREMDEERMVDVQWNVDRKRTYPVNIRIYCKDKKGLLNDLSNAMSSMGVNISYANIDTKSMPLENYATCDFQLDIKDLEQLNKLVAELRKIKNVVSVERIKELSYKGEKKSGTFSH